MATIRSRVPGCVTVASLLGLAASPVLHEFHDVSPGFLLYWLLSCTAALVLGILMEVFQRA